MRIRRPLRRPRGCRLALLLGGAACAGLLAGLHLDGIIDKAGAWGMFGGVAAAPFEPAAAPTEHDRAMGAALAVAIGVDRPADCRALSPRFRAGCRDQLRGWAAEERDAMENALRQSRRPAQISADLSSGR